MRGFAAATRSREEGRLGRGTLAGDYVYGGFWIPADTLVGRPGQGRRAAGRSTERAADQDEVAWRLSIPLRKVERLFPRPILGAQTRKTGIPGLTAPRVDVHTGTGLAS